MRIVRYCDQDAQPRYGWVVDDPEQGLMVGPLEGDPFGEFRRVEALHLLEEIEILAPVVPSKILCVGRNYVAHAAEKGNEVPDVPLLFMKPPSSIIGPGETIYLPPQTQHVEHEGELVVVIGKRARWVSPEDAFDYILGYTIANDVTARDLQVRDGQWTRAKGFDTFCPVGPWIETDFDPADARISCHVNDELRQMASTRDMVFGIRQLIAYASSVMTLETGDLLLTGTPAGVGPLEPDDLVSVTIEGLGELSNRVLSEPPH